MGRILTQRVKPTLILKILFPITLFPLLIQDYKEVAYINYILQLIVYVLIFIATEDKIRLLFSPAFFTCMYLYISFLTADIMFRNGLYIDGRQYFYYCNWKHMQLSNTYINICTYLSIATYYWCLNKAKPLVLAKWGFKDAHKARFIALVLFLCILPFANMKMIADINDTVLGVISVIIIYLSSKSSSKVRFIWYMAIVLLSGISNPDDKRNSAFLFFVIALIEFRKVYSLKFKYSIIAGISIAAFVILILIMSIIRTGKTNDVFGAIDIIPQYISNDRTIPVLADNFEVNYVYINTFQSIEFVENDSKLLAYGTSYIKPLFLFIDRSIFPDKPLSTMTLYTQKFDSLAAAEGYCLPLTLASEAFWNFGILGIMVCVLIFYLLNSFYNRGYLEMNNKDNFDYSNCTFLYIFYVTLFLIRGSGFDIYLSKIISFFMVSYVIKFFFLKKKLITVN